MYKQIDRVAMESPLAPILTNMFVGIYEKQIFGDIVRPLIYHRYAEVTVVMLKNECVCD